MIQPSTQEPPQLFDTQRHNGRYCLSLGARTKLRSRCNLPQKTSAVWYGKISAAEQTGITGVPIIFLCEDIKRTQRGHLRLSTKHMTTTKQAGLTVPGVFPVKIKQAATICSSGWGVSSTNHRFSPPAPCKQASTYSVVRVRKGRRPHDTPPPRRRKLNKDYGEILGAHDAAADSWMPD